MHASHEVDFDGFYGGFSVRLENRESGGGISCGIGREEGATGFKLRISSYPLIYQPCTRDIVISTETWYTLQMEIANDYASCRIIEKGIQVKDERISEEIYTGTFLFGVSEHDLSLDDFSIYSERPLTWPNFPATCE